MEEIEWVEVRAPSVEEATRVALQELGLKSADAAEVEVLNYPSNGFLGMGGQDAVIRVKAKSPPARGGRRRTRGGRGRSRPDRKASPAKAKERPDRREGPPPGPAKRAAKQEAGGEAAMTKQEDDREEKDPAEQAEEIESFLSGLLDALGLEGSVATRVEDGVIYADVTGEQTEALVGPKGSILQATLELCRTIVQRRSQAGARIRLDIAGYNERRREALKIYAQRLGEKVLAEGEEIMLEPMNAADRKVVHDTIGTIDGVRSYSEGEEPRRSVVVAALTRARRGLVSEVLLTPGNEGVPTECVVNLDNIHTIPRDRFRRRVATLSPQRMADACRALVDAVGC